MYQGDWSEWVVYSEVTKQLAYIKSKKKGLVYIPVRGWQYSDFGPWEDDDTLTVTGKHISCLTLN